MVTFLLASPKRDRSTIDILVSFRGKKYRRTTRESVPVKFWSKIKRRAKVTKDFTEGESINAVLDSQEIAAIKTLSCFKEHVAPPTKEEFFAELDKNYYKTTEPNSSITFINALQKFLDEKRLSDLRRRSYMVLKRTVERYQLYIGGAWMLDALDADALYRFEKFLREEHTFFVKDDHGKRVCIDKYRQLYEQVYESRLPEERGNNTIAAIFRQIIAVLNYAVENELTANANFRKYSPPKEIYGTPYYLTLEEVKHIYHCELSPALTTQRDIFVFQCLVGCRVGDLYRFTKSNVANGVLRYVPDKTKGKSQRIVEVPLNGTTKEILGKYYTDDTAVLFPFISLQKYNDAIKSILTKAGITRRVIVINPVTGKEESIPINTVASSHLARRTFVGNLYKKVRDPNLIGVMSGHVEGSRAFARYRDIDNDMKKELVDMIEL